LSSCKRKYTDNEAASSKNNEASSSTEPVREKPEGRKYDTNYLFRGFTDIDVDGEERPQYLLCMKVLAVENMNPNKLKRHLVETVHAVYGGKHLTFTIEI
jgi:hypothetical protein